MNTKEILQGIKDWAAPKVIYDISAAHNNTKYTDLADALGTKGGNIPQEYRKGGITVRYVQASDNKYVQYRLMTDEWSTTESDWQGVDDEPTSGSNNLVESGGVVKLLDKKVDNYLKDKTIVCFGDSITEFYGREEHKRYSDYIADYTGATVINVGIGGTCIRERANPVIDQSAGYQDSNYAALDIVNIVRAACDVRYDENYTYLQLAQIAAEYIRDNRPGGDDNTAQIQRLAAIDWSKVDYVTVFAGTNDWRSGDKNKWGESGSHDAYTTMGAINEIIRLISSTFKHIKLFWFTPIVRWIGYTGTPESMIEDNFSDYFTYDGVTLKELSAKIQREVSFNHIPVCDLYNGLGWNMNNFSEYFGDNPTHPYYGFAPIARKIVDFIKSGNSNVREIVPTELYNSLNGKVDKEDGKGLIDNQYVEEAESDEFIKAICDADGKVLQGIKKNGSPYFPHNEMMEVDGIFGYNHVVLDNENKVVEGIDEEGRHVFNAGVEISQLKSESGIESGDWLDVKTDSDGRILEGINKDGEKHISKFDKSTQDLIKDFAGGGSAAGSDYISIPILDAYFTSPVPMNVIGTKGTDNAQYEFELPLSEETYNIRFKFRITENLINNNKNATIAKLGSINIVTAISQQLSQFTSTYEVGGVQKTSYWPCFYGGVRLNESIVSSERTNKNIGLFAFYIQYTGSNDYASVENTGESFIIKDGDSQTELLFSQYPSVAELYEAIKAITNISVSYNELENRTCDELAVFPETRLVSSYYTAIDGTTKGQKIEYNDAAPLFIPYAVDKTWHQVEIVKINGIIYSACDGYVRQVQEADSTMLTLGGSCGVLFKDFEVFTDSSYDAEIVDDKLISSVNPYVIIYEGHGIDKLPSNETTTSENMNTTVDRLQYVFSYLKSKGYVPVSIYDIADYYNGIKMLPKRSYTIIFDDFRFDIAMDLENRAVFTRFGVLPSLALYTVDVPDIIHNGVVIDIATAARICKIHGFDLVSHTRAHRANDSIKPSTFISELTQDIYDADDKDIDGEILVYPFGRNPYYMLDVMKWLGYKLGIDIYSGNINWYNILNTSRYNLTRGEIGMRMNINTILQYIR
jgi:lysophospholipase L1-like esterase